MFSLLLLALSLAALAQFGVYYWRSLVAGIAAQPVSDRVCEAAGLNHQVPAAEDFDALLSLHRLTPDLEGPAGKLTALQVYYSAMSAVRKLTQSALPAAARWAGSEMSTCSRYVAVLVGQRLESNLACAAAIRSV